MSGLWRIAVLFMLPGAVLGGGSVIAFFRLGDCQFEPLTAAWIGALLWSCSAALSAQLFYFKHNPSRFYYPLMLTMAVAFTAGLGLCRWAGGGGLIEGAAGVIISGAVAGGLSQGFSGSSTGRLDRWYLAAGVIGSSWVFIWLSDYQRLEWMETFFFYLGELLILCWALASPVSCRGKKSKCWAVRLLLLAIAAVSIKISPVYAGKTAKLDCRKIFPEGIYNRTSVTANGSCSTLMAPDGFYGYFTADSRLLAWSIGDEELQPAIPCLLSALKNSEPEIRLIATPFTVLPGLIREVTGKSPELCFMPQSMCWDLLGGGGICDIFKRSNHEFNNSIIFADQLDLLLITALPDNQYSGSIENFWEEQTARLKHDGLAAISSAALANPSLYRLAHEKFLHSTFLPDAGRIWVFSNHPLDLSWRTVDENLKKLYGETIPSRSYAELIGDTVYAPPPEAAQLLAGKNLWWGEWPYFAIAAAILAAWKILRIFGERRSIMYDYLNCVENGFCGMLLQLLVIHILVVNSGIVLLTTAMLPLLWCFIFCRARSGWITGAVLSWIILLLTLNGNLPWYAMLVVLLQNSLLTGEVQNCAGAEMLNVRQKRMLWCGAFYGMILASGMMAVCWIWNVPLAVAGLAIAAVRLPIIWQYGKMRVY